MAFQYSVAIRLSVANLASQGIRILAADLLKAHGAATNLQSKLSALKMAAIGYGVSKIGDGMLGFLEKSVDASKEYTHQLALMNAAGFTQKEIAGSIASAWQTSSAVITSTAQKNLETIRELRSAFGKGEGMQHAYAVMPQVARVSAIMESLTGKPQERIGFDMVKAIELGTKGALSVDSMMRQSEAMTKALVQMGGTLSVSDFHQAIKYSRAMAPYMTDQFKYEYLPTLMQEMKAGPSGGASSAGNVIASLGQVIVGQAIPKALIGNWIASGLINPGSVVKDPHNRTTSKIVPGGVAGQNLFGANPYFWAQQYAKPAVERLMAKNNLDQYGAILALTHNRMAAFGLQTLINKAPQFERDRKLITEGPSSYTSYQRLLKADPQMAEQALHSQWQNLLAIIGYQILPKLLPVMVQFATSLNSIASAMQRHPALTKALVIGFGALGLALSILGKVLMGAALIKFLGAGPLIQRAFSMMLLPLRMLVGAIPYLARGFASLLVGIGPVGWVILGIGAVALLVWNNWKEIKTQLGLIWTDIKTGVVMLFRGDILGGFKYFAVALARGFQTLFNTIIAGLNAVLPNALQIGKFHFADDMESYLNPKRPAAIPGATGQRQQSGHVYLDSKKVGRVVWETALRGSNATMQSGGLSFNGDRTRAPIAVGP